MRSSEEHRTEISHEHFALGQGRMRTFAWNRSVPAPLPQPVGDVLMVLQDQAQFQPQAYVAHLAGLAAAGGRAACTNTRA